MQGLRDATVRKKKREPVGEPKNLSANTDGLLGFRHNMSSEPNTKGDREHQGATYHTPALKMLCPVEAYINWITVAGLTSGPGFRGIDRWGNLSTVGVNPHSLIPMLRRILAEAGLPAAMYSSHSLRRGFATWASANGWDIKALMTYVGWKDMQSALRYIDASASFEGLAVGKQGSDLQIGR